MTPRQLIAEAAGRGLRLEPRGNKLAVIPADRLTPDFAKLLRTHKAELLALLGGQPRSLQANQIPWLHVARQILAGEFDGADRSTVDSLTIGLHSIQHPLCQRAHDRINPELRGRRATP